MLDALVSDTFEPLERFSLCCSFTFKTALLLALTSTEWVCEMTALLVNLCYLLLQVRVESYSA